MTSEPTISTGSSERNMLRDMIAEEVVRGQEPDRICWLAEKFCEISPHECRYMDLLVVLTRIRDMLRRSRTTNHEGR